MRAQDIIGRKGELKIALHRDFLESPRAVELLNSVVLLAAHRNQVNFTICPASVSDDESGMWCLC